MSVIEYFCPHRRQLRVNLRVAFLTCLKIKNIEWNEMRRVRLEEMQRVQDVEMRRVQEEETIVNDNGKRRKLNVMMLI